MVLGYFRTPIQGQIQFLRFLRIKVKCQRWEPAQGPLVKGAHVPSPYSLVQVLKRKNGLALVLRARPPAAVKLPSQYFVDEYIRCEFSLGW